MSKKIPQQNIMYETKRGLPVLCMSAHQWVFEEKDEKGNLIGYEIQITTNPLKIENDVLVQKNKGHIAKIFISNKKVSMGSRGYGDGSTIEDFQKIYKIFQEAN